MRLTYPLMPSLLLMASLIGAFSAQSQCIEISQQPESQRDCLGNSIRMICRSNASSIQWEKRLPGSGEFIPIPYATKEQFQIYPSGGSEHPSGTQYRAKLQLGDCIQYSNSAEILLFSLGKIQHQRVCEGSLGEWVLDIPPGLSPFLNSVQWQWKSPSGFESIEASDGFEGSSEIRLRYPNTSAVLDGKKIRALVQFSISPNNDNDGDQDNRNQALSCPRISDEASIQIQSLPQATHPVQSYTACLGDRKTITAQGCAPNQTLWFNEQGQGLAEGARANILFDQASPQMLYARCSKNTCLGPRSAGVNVQGLAPTPPPSIDGNPKRVSPGTQLILVASGGSHNLWYLHADDSKPISTATTLRIDGTMVKAPSIKRWVSQEIQSCESTRVPIEIEVGEAQASQPIPVPNPTPVQNPVESPSINPTPSPTPMPVETPSSSPAPIPVQNPVESPSINPTPSPTPMPVETPSSSPAPIPVQNPVESPSINPTPSPTPMPVETPSNSPAPMIPVQNPVGLVDHPPIANPPPSPIQDSSLVKTKAADSLKLIVRWDCQAMGHWVQSSKGDSIRLLQSPIRWSVQLFLAQSKTSSHTITNLQGQTQELILPEMKPEIKSGISHEAFRPHELRLWAHSVNASFLYWEKNAHVISKDSNLWVPKNKAEYQAVFQWGDCLLRTETYQVQEEPMAPLDSNAKTTIAENTPSQKVAELTLDQDPKAWVPREGRPGDCPWFPNPNPGKVIHFYPYGSFYGARLQISDLAGSILWEQSLAGGAHQQTLVLPKLNAGQYLFILDQKTKIKPCRILLLDEK